MATYRKVKKIGSGGFGEVWVGERQSDKKTFAMKYLSTKDPDDVNRFKKEVRCLSQLDHPNIVRIVGKALTGAPYFYVMPLYKRSLYENLPSVVGNHERISSIFRQVLDAVRYAHSEGIIHRDLKPENVLMNSDTDLGVSDFGLGRILDSTSTRLTKTGARLGTPYYCAPEQVQDAKNADHRADVFSLGRMLYELYAGELTTAVQELSLLPVPIAAIVERATAGNREHRYPTVAAMLEDFESAMEVLLGIVEAGSLEDTIEKLRSTGSWTRAEIDALAIRLEEVADESDTVHKVLMKLPAKAFAELAARSRRLARRLIRTFAEHVASQGWPFSYTDEIADVSAAIFRETSDPEIRAELLAAVLSVGGIHNRWDVLRTGAALLREVQEPGDVAAVSSKLKSSRNLEHIIGYVDRQQLHPAIRRLIPKATE